MAPQPSQTSLRNSSSTSPNNNFIVTLFTNLYTKLSKPLWDIPYMLLLLLLETLLCLLILHKIPYTEIDWIAYMEEVSSVVEDGELDYYNIRGQTGPLVYPAGFVYVYALLRYVAGGDGSDVFKAQCVFVGLYVLHAGLVLTIYTSVMRCMVSSFATKPDLKKSDNNKKQDCSTTMASVVWSWRVAMLLCCLSKRIHSIFILRLFNDAICMLFFYAAVVLGFIPSRWRLGCVLYSLSVSIKMNTLLFAPGLLLLMLQAHETLLETVFCLGICAGVQLVAGAPFLLTHPVHYIRKAFEFDRVFFFKWTVNWKFLPEEIFLSKPLAITLLLLHLTTLGLCAAKWLQTASIANKQQTNGATKRSLFLISRQNNNLAKEGTKNHLSLSPSYIVYTLFASNMIGICFARTLHYQFYSWYFHTVPLLLWMQFFYCSSSFGNVTTSAGSILGMTTKMIPCVILVGMMEYAFNVYPATPTSSVVLQVVHLFVLLGIVKTPLPHIFATTTRK